MNAFEHLSHPPLWDRGDARNNCARDRATTVCTGSHVASCMGCSGCTRRGCRRSADGRCLRVVGQHDRRLAVLADHELDQDESRQNRRDPEDLRASDRRNHATGLKLHPEAAVVVPAR